MAMICKSGAAECSGCMRCYDEEEGFEQEYGHEEEPDD